MSSEEYPMDVEMFARMFHWKHKMSGKHLSKRVAKKRLRQMRVRLQEYDTDIKRSGVACPINMRVGWKKMYAMTLEWIDTVNTAVNKYEDEHANAELVTKLEEVLAKHVFLPADFILKKVYKL